MLPRSESIDQEKIMVKQSSIGIGLIGCGNVGSGVVQLLHEHSEMYRLRCGNSIQIRRVLVRQPRKYRRLPDLNPRWLTADPEAFFATPGLDVVVEVAGGTGVVAQYVRRALDAGKHVVTANKSMLAAQGPSLFTLAHQRNVSIAFEASCCGGIPVITALQFGLMANRIDALFGILNGTCNYILTQMTQARKTFALALREAQEKGYAEADPTLDVSGQDAAQKLTVLATLAFGQQVQLNQVSCEGIDRLCLEDVNFGSELGYDIKLLGIAQRVAVADQRKKKPAQDGLSLRVQPCFIPKRLPLAQVHDAFNALSVYGQANGHTMYYGRGAGMMPTASAVVSDILNIASGWYPQAFARMGLWADVQKPARVIPVDELRSRYYLRINAMDKPGVMARIARLLGDADISISSVLQHEVAEGRFVPVVVTTHNARWGALQRALDRIEQLKVIQGRPVSIRIVDMPVG